MISGAVLSGLSGGLTRWVPLSAGACRPYRTSRTPASIAAPRHITHGSSVETRMTSSASSGQQRLPGAVIGGGVLEGDDLGVGGLAPQGVDPVVAARDDLGLAVTEAGEDRADGRFALGHALLGLGERGAHQRFLLVGGEGEFGTWPGYTRAVRGE